MSNRLSCNAINSQKSAARLVTAAVFMPLLLSLASCASHDGKSERDSAWIKKHELYDGNDDALFLHSEFKGKGDEDAKKKPPTKEELVASGDSAWQANDMERALFEYLRALKLDERDSAIYFKIGRIYDLKGDVKLAEAGYLKSLEFDAQYLPAIERLGTMQLKQRDYASAESSFRKAIELDQQRMNGKSKAAAGEQRSAPSAADRAPDAAIDSGSLGFKADQQSPFYAYIGMGVIQDLTGNTARGLQYYAVAKQIAPEAPSVYNNIGYSHYLANSLPLAEKYFRQAISLNANYVEAWRNLALIYVRRGDYNKALDILVSKFQDEPSAYNMVGYLCMLDAQYELAESFFQKAIAASPVYYKAANENLKKNREMRASGRS